MTYDSGDPKEVKKAKQRASSIDEKLANGFVKICSDPETRLVLSNFLETARVFTTAFHNNPTEHAYNEGYRNAGLWFLTNALLHDSDIVSKMQQDKLLNIREDFDHDRTSGTDTSSE